MTEGVLAVDLEERVIIVNRALGELFAVDPRRAKGRYLQEVIRKTEVHQFVRDLPGPGDSTSDLELAFGDRILQAHGAVMRDASGKRSGAVIVFRDITRLRALEKTRRDFIANVSHELKTPITSIKGYVETLLDGSVSDAEQTTRFLTIIGNRADQLAEMIDDLLDLARIERETEEGSVDREECLVGDLVAEAVGLCEQSASVRGQRIRVDGSEELSVRVNRRSFPQAIINLIDNAVKYGPDGSTITVSASAEGETVVTRVADEGPGIARKHHDRLFERFYRVDTSRSRDSGGTGLGLAIVKHIALAHSGTVAVDSEPGRGSTFEIRLPRANV